MKNLPDEELFGKLKVRLQNFEEDPGDDVWQNVEAAVRPASTQTRTRYALIAILMLLSLGREFLLHDDRGISPSSQIVPGDELSDNLKGGKSAIDETPGGNAPPVLQPSNLSRAETMNDSPGGNDIETTAATASGAKGAIAHVPSQAAADKKKNSHHYPTGGATIVNPSASDQTSGDIGFRKPGTAGTLSYSQEVFPDSAKVKESITSSVTVGSELNAPSPLDTLTAHAITKPDSVIHQAAIVVTKAQRRQRLLRAYGMATPSMTFHHVSPSTNDDVMFEKLNSPGVLSSERFSFSVEAGIQFPLARQLHMFTGLTYYQQSTDLSLEQLMPGVTNIPSGSSLDFNFQPNTAATTINYRMQNIGMVTGMSYVISVGEIIQHLGGALQYEYGIVARGAGNDKVSSQNFLNFRIFYRAEYGFHERLSIFVQPTFTRSLLNDEVMNASIRVKQSRAGIGIGLLYRLK